MYSPRVHAMSKILSGYRTARGNHMANMSASILRNLVSAVFNVPALDVRISGPIDPKWNLEYTVGISYCATREDGEKHIWGYSPQTGFVEIPAVSQSVLSRGNHDKDYVEWSPSLYSIIDKGEYVLHNQYQFFLVEAGTEDSSTWTIYGSVDFDKYRDKVADQLDHFFNHIIEDTW